MKNRNIISVRFGLITFFIFCASLLYSQSTVSCDLKFVGHMVETGDFNEALFLLDSTGCSGNSSNDSVYYFRGWSLYSLKRLSASTENLIKVSQKSEWYLKSHFFAAYNYTYTGNFKSALEILSALAPETESQISLKNFETAGVHLLQGDIVRYNESLDKTNSDLFGISGSLNNLRKISKEMTKHKSRSSVMAGILSGIIPGSGKFYAGKRGEAISAFIGTVGLGLVTFENYRKNGLNNFITIASGAAFAFSYTANIYGAVMTVNIIETEYRENVKNSILFNLHIPLRNTFDR
jgi:hypothetical protein